MLLGHHDLEETTVYLHLSHRHLGATASPRSAQVRTGFQQVGVETVTQSVRMHLFFETRTLGGFVASVLGCPR